MTRFNTLLVSGLLAGGTLLALPAAAQVTSLAVIDPAAAILNAKALGSAVGTIGTTYKSQLDQVAARRTALSAEVKATAAPLDTNKDGQISDAELQAAQAAKNPVLDRLKTAQSNAEAELARLNQPMARAEVYAIEQIMQRYTEAMQNVVNTKKIPLVLSADAVLFGQPAADITNDVKVEIDRLAPTVSIAPPANWQASQQAVQLFQQFQQAQAAAAQQAAQQPAGAAPAGAAPAPAAPRPAAPAPAGTRPQPQGR